jgi:hypothetical protein
MRSGSPIQFDIALLDSTGAGLSYASKAAFESAGWSLTFIDMSTGAAVTPTLGWTLAPVTGVAGRHTVAGLTLTTSAWFVRITPPSTSYAFSLLPSAMWTGEQYDTDSLYARLNSIYGVNSVTAVPGLTLNDMVEGDSYQTTISVPPSYLTRMGWTDLTGCTLHGTIRRPDDTTLGTPAATLTMVSDPILAIGSPATNFSISWTTYPSGMVLTSPERSAGSVKFRVEVQAVKSGKQLTILYNSPLTVYRQDDNT